MIDQRKWNVKWEVSVGDFLILLSSIAAVFLAYGKLDTRVSLLEQSQAAQAAEQDKSTRRLETAIGEINQKLDRLIERQHK